MNTQRERSTRGMIQARPYEFMVQYTPQREWVEKRGILLWLAFFFVELGAGMFIISSIFDIFAGMLIAWLICATLGGGLHLLYIGRPLRIWRMLLSSGWKTSWISRGLYFIIIFLSLGLLHIVLVRRTTYIPTVMVVTNIFAFLTIIYGGFAMAFVNGIKLWNTPMVPILFTVAGIWGGVGLTIVTVLATGNTQVVPSLEMWSRIFLEGFTFLLIIYLVTIRYSGEAGRISVRQIVTERWRTVFWVIVVGLGVVLPLIAILSNWIGGFVIPPLLLYVLVLSELLGDLSFRYCLLRCGYYSPLVPTTSYKY